MIFDLSHTDHCGSYGNNAYGEGTLSFKLILLNYLNAKTINYAPGNDYKYAVPALPVRYMRPIEVIHKGVKRKKALRITRGASFNV